MGKVFNKMRLILILFFLVNTMSLQAVIENSLFGDLIADEQGNITSDIQKIASMTGISPVPTTLHELVKVTQKEWLRTSGTERWDIDPLKYQNLEKELNPYFKKLKLIDAIEVSALVCPDYFVVLGGVAESLALRFQYLERFLSLADHKASQIIILVGQRYITQQEKDFLQQNKCVDDLKTETDVARHLINNTDFYPIIKDANVVIVDAPAIINEQGIQQRPNTDSTVNEWLKMKPNPGTIVAISTVPFAHYQDAILRVLLPSGFSLTTVGPLYVGHLSVGLYLDSLARWIYAESKHREKMSKNC